VNIANEFQKIGGFLARHRLETILKKMAVSAAGAVIPQCTGRQETAHDLGDGDGAGPEQQSVF
jgi:hypothetical protein